MVFISLFFLMFVMLTVLSFVARVWGQLAFHHRTGFGGRFVSASTETSRGSLRDYSKNLLEPTSSRPGEPLVTGAWQTAVRERRKERR